MLDGLVLSNGELQVVLDEAGSVRQLFFPYVGHELHTKDQKHRIGVWIDGQMSWLDSGDWTHKSRLSYSGSIGHRVMTNERIGILLEFEDFVSAEKNAFIRNIHIVNLRAEQRAVQLFLHQAFRISNSLSVDTAQYLSDEPAILHYSGRRAFVVGGKTDVGQDFDQQTVGLYGDGLDGTWRDAEDGVLSDCKSSCGLTDSTLCYSMTIGGFSSRRVHTWLVAGTSIKSAVAIHRDIKRIGVQKSLETTLTWWRRWLSPSLKLSEKISPKLRQPFVHNLMYLRNHIDNRGAMITNFQNSVGYCRPSDGSSAIWPLIRLGYKNETMNYFTFCKHSLASDGFLMNLYRTDGAIGEMVRPYTGSMPPIDPVDTAMTLFMIIQTRSLGRNDKSLIEYYDSLIVPMANFLSDYVGESGFPERATADVGDLGDTYRVAIVSMSLMATAEFADSLGRQGDSVKWRIAADDFRRLAEDRLISDDQISHSVDAPAPSIASMFGSYMFGLVDIDDPRLDSSIKVIEEQLRRQDGLFAIGSEDNQQIDYLGSLWMAQYYIEKDRTAEAEVIVMAVIDQLSSAGSIENEVRIRAEIVSTLLDTIAK